MFEGLGVMQDINGVKRKEWDGKEEERAVCAARRRARGGRQQRGDHSDETKRRK